MRQTIERPFGKWMIIVYCVCILSCNPEKTDNTSNIVNSILHDSTSFYFVNFKKIPSETSSLPIGIFDSGTGGLAVMETILKYDGLHNQTLQDGEDGIPDFDREQFVFLADQANMPYGNYYAEGKSTLLEEHIVKDAQFLLSNKYYQDQSASHAMASKLPPKVIVIACNTATVYGKNTLEEMLEMAGSNIKVIGVIDAGAKGALTSIGKSEDATIGVFATVGTIASEGYPTALRKLQHELGYKGTIEIVSQGGYGLAEAIDGEPGFVDPNAVTVSPDYKGPSFTHEKFPIDSTLLAAYNFHKTEKELLCVTSGSGDCGLIQLNSPENYARYHIVSLLEKIKQRPNAPELKAIILGCTHYPYLKKELQNILSELYNLKQDGKYVYRDVMVENVMLVDPAQNVAVELSQHLRDQKLFGTNGDGRCEFFISVPNLDNSNVRVMDSTHFTYEYKYGRNAGTSEEYVKVVPFHKRNIPKDVLQRLSISVPEVYTRIENFMQKTRK